MTEQEIARSVGDNFDCDVYKREDKQPKKSMKNGFSSTVAPLVLFLKKWLPSMVSCIFFQNFPCVYIPIYLWTVIFSFKW